MDDIFPDGGIPIVFDNIFTVGDPYGADVPGPTNVSISDAVRSETAGTPYDRTLTNSGSISDVLRGDVPSPQFDAGIYNPNVPDVVQAGATFNVMDVVGSIVAAAGKILTGGAGTSNSNPRNSPPSLWQRIFGTTPTASGQAPNQMLMASILVVAVVFGVMLLKTLKVRA